MPIFARISGATAARPERRPLFLSGCIHLGCFSLLRAAAKKEVPYPTLSGWYHAAAAGYGWRAKQYAAQGGLHARMAMGMRGQLGNNCSSEQVGKSLFWRRLRMSKEQPGSSVITHAPVETSHWTSPDPITGPAEATGLDARFSLCKTPFFVVL